MRTSRIKKVLAISSGGGHWVELLRVLPAFEGTRLVFVTVRRDYAVSIPGQRLHVINDATRWNKLAVLLMALRVLAIVLWEQPDIIVSTGAAPGYFALRFGRLIRARTIWIDSIANVEELSMSGRMAGRFADLWLTQWQHLAQPRGPHWAGAVL